MLTEIYSKILYKIFLSCFFLSFSDEKSPRLRIYNAYYRPRAPYTQRFYYTDYSILNEPNHEAPHADFCSRLLLLLMFIQVFVYLYKHLMCLFLNINQLVALNFIMSLFHASTCFEHNCSSSEVQNFGQNFGLLTMSTCARNM